jgi:hypothetical protein
MNKNIEARVGALEIVKNEVIDVVDFGARLIGELRLGFSRKLYPFVYGIGKEVDRK